MKPRYRAWDKEENRWINIASLVFDEEGELWYLSPVMDDFNPVYYENELGKTWEIMQSTGLKDKNGVEIFEGDVIFYAYFETNANNRLVKFVNGQFIAELIRNGYHKSLINVIDDAEIIGNIYEHPELLEVK